MRLGGQGEDARASGLDLDDVAHGLVKQRRIAAQRHDERTGLDERDRPVLELARGVGLGVDVGDLLELQGALHAERVIQIPADEEDGIVVEVLRGVILDLLAVRQDLLDLRGQRGDGARQAAHILRRDGLPLAGQIDGQQVEDRHLGGIRLRGGDGDLGPGPGVEHIVRLTGDGAADDIYN